VKEKASQDWMEEVKEKKEKVVVVVMVESKTEIIAMHDICSKWAPIRSTSVPKVPTERGSWLEYWLPSSHRWRSILCNPINEAGLARRTASTVYVVQRQ